ncbi:MAG: hypothetical protein GX650_02125 [Clostridiales bacterium]|nr:hypothetical protein [Clostridiales bacterium]
MKRQLRRAFWAVGIITLAAVLLFVGVMLRRDVVEDQGNLKAILNTATAWTGEANSSLDILANKIADSSPALRVTFMLPNGIVLADSGDTLPDGQRLLQRPEIRQALQGGIGEGIDWSTPLRPVLYAATLLGQAQMILLVSIQNTEIIHMMTMIVPGVLLLVGLMALSARLFLRPVTQRLTAQLQQVQALLEGTLDREQIDPQGYYPELKPTMENICLLIDRMRYDLQQISATQDMQRDFVNNTSHELKSPLTSILGFAEMLEENEDLPPHKKAEYLQYILTDSRRMLAVIENILLLQKEAPLPENDLPPVNLRKVAEEVRRSLMPQCEPRGIRILVEGSLGVRALEQDMWELLRNLMSNAVRYGKQDGWVEVRMQEGALSVRDDGVGIAEEHLTRIFEKFYRVDKSRNRGMGGTGLGLSIVAGLVNRYGASIHVDSTLGEGTCFTVTFPPDRLEESSQ